MVVVADAFAMISLASISMCAAVAAPPTISAGLLFAVPDASVVFDSVYVPVTVPPDRFKYVDEIVFPLPSLVALVALSALVA